MTINDTVKQLHSQGRTVSEIYMHLIREGVFRVEAGKLYSINRPKPLAEGTQKARGALRISVGNPGRPIAAPRLAWMIHTGQMPPPGASVIQLGDKRDYSWENLALVAKGHEQRLSGILRQ